jgi:hypothetical protein
MVINNDNIWRVFTGWGHLLRGPLLFSWFALETNNQPPSGIRINGWSVWKENVFNINMLMGRKTQNPSLHCFLSILWTLFPLFSFYLDGTVIEFNDWAVARSKIHVGLSSQACSCSSEEKMQIQQIRIIFKDRVGFSRKYWVKIKFDKNF